MLDYCYQKPKERGSKMKKKMNQKAIVALKKYRNDIKSGKISISDIRGKRIAALEEKLETAKIRVKKIEEKLEKAKKVGIKSTVKKTVTNLTAEQLLKINEMIENGEI